MPKLLIPAEPGDETRVAATPETVKRLRSAGLEVLVESGAGAAARYPDEEFAEAGAQIVEPGSSWEEADIVGVVGPPEAHLAERLHEGAILIGLLSPARNLDLVKTLRDAKATALALELVPRISRAQNVDALSSQANVSGYRSVILAAHALDKYFPLFMTAAGTIRPANVVVLGAGVAGLQAIATARRLGAIVQANDVRAAAAGEVASLGATFIDVPGVTDQEGAGGYARVTGKEMGAAQREALTPYVAEAHAVICTAAVPGKPAPVIITREMVERMPAGSVVIDAAAGDGGNCELTDPDHVVEHGEVRIIPAPSLASAMPHEASALYARNVLGLVQLLMSEEGAVVVDRDDEVIAGASLTDAGTVTHGPTAEQLGDHVPAEEAPSPGPSETETTPPTDKERE